MDNCIFCKIIAGDIPSRKVYEDDTAFAFLDLSPWQVGHTLVIPKEHSVDALEHDGVLPSIASAVAAVGALLKEKLGASAVNILSNAGADAGQEVFHTHVHLIPRYADSPGLAAIKGAVDEDLDVTLNRLTD